MKFTTTLKDVPDRTVYNDLTKMEEYGITSIYIDWELNQEVREWGVKSQSVSVTKVAIGMMDQNDDEIDVNDYKIQVKQPDSTLLISISEVEVDMPNKMILINFL